MNNDWTLKSRQIKALLVLAGVRPIDIARKAGVSKQSVNDVINRGRRIARVEGALITLGVPENLWLPHKKSGRPKK